MLDDIMAHADGDTAKAHAMVVAAEEDASRGSSNSDSDDSGEGSDNWERNGMRDGGVSNGHGRNGHAKNGHATREEQQRQQEEDEAKAKAKEEALYEVKKEGGLLKRTAGKGVLSMSKWHLRFFVLESKRLLYFVDSSRKTKKGDWGLDDMSTCMLDVTTKAGMADRNVIGIQVMCTPTPHSPLPPSSPLSPHSLPTPHSIP
jgi:hypothetical protein